MAQSTAQKLRIRAGFRLRTLHAPAGFRSGLGDLPAGVTMGPALNAFDQVHWFVTTRAGMEADMPAVLNLLADDIVCWIYYPKGSSGQATDLTRDKGWDALLTQDLQWLSLISFDDTWSAFGMRRPTAGAKKATDPAPRAIFNHIDPVKKEVYLPEDLATAFAAAPDEARLFQNLSFSNKKEYLEWIVSAKREATRTTRVRETITRLAKGWKNPANR